MDLGDAVLRLSTDNSELDKGLDKASKDAEKAGKEIGAALIAGFTAAIAFSKKLVDAWGESEDASARLTAAIRSTGQAGAISAGEMAKLAAEIQKTTRFEDDQAVAAAAALISIGKFTEEGVKRALPALADYAAATGTDLVTAAQQMAQAIEGGRNIFVRFGAETKDGMTKTEKFDEILRALNKSFRGTAEELRNNTIGQLTSLKNLFNDLAESGGRALSIVFKPFLEIIGPIVQKLADFANRTFEMSDALDAVKKGTADASQRILVFGDMLEIATKKKKALQTELDKKFFSGETLTASDFQRLEKINDEVAQLTKLLEKAKNELKLAKGDKKTIIANIGGEADVAALAKLNQSLDDMGNRYQAIGQAYKDAQIAESMAMFIASSEDMANRTQAMGRAYKEAADMALNLGTNIRGLEDRFASVLPAIEGIAEPTQAALLAVSQAVGQAMQAAADASEDAAADSAQAWKDAQDGIKTFVDFASSAFSAIQDIASQFYKNQNALIDNELRTTLNALDAKYKKERSAIDATMKAGEAKYEADKLAIENSTLSEAEKTAALKKLDEDYYGALTKLDEDFEAAKLAAEKTAQGERNRIALDQFRAEKTATLTGIAIDTAKAIIQTFAQLGFTPFGAIAALAMTAMGITQAALVANQPEPVFPALAQGGEFTVPPGYDNDSFLARMSSGERVSVTPAGEGGDQVIENHIYLDGTQIGEWFTKATRNRRVLIASRAIIE